MKNILYIILLSTQVFFGQISSFEKGNTLYKNGNYQAAITAYESVLGSKKHSAELYFNLGNCYYKLNKIAPSIYNYEKALLLNPDDSEILNNLKFAQKLQVDEVKEFPNVGFSKIIDGFTSTFNYNTWAWISVGFGSLFLVFFMGYYLSSTTASKRNFFIGLFGIFFLELLSIGAAFFERNQNQNSNPAIVFAEVVSVKSEPKETASDAFILHEGTKVYIKESLDNWLQVELGDGTDGWIEKQNVKFLK